MIEWEHVDPMEQIDFENAKPNDSRLLEDVNAAWLEIETIGSMTRRKDVLPETCWELFPESIDQGAQCRIGYDPTFIEVTNPNGPSGSRLAAQCP